MENFYLSNILNINCSTTENIVAILKARGFLIDCIDGIYYLSDNASLEDIEFLKKGLTEYKIGEIIDENSYHIKTRRSWNNTLAERSYRYESIEPASIKIRIYENAEIGSAIDFFNSRKQIGFGVSNPVESWKRFSIEEFGNKVPAIYLEAYVSYYVKAISSCGVRTYFSCDGNHPNGGKIEVKSLYPSNIWHEAIWQYLVNKKYGDVDFIEYGIYFEDGTQENMYQKLYFIADFLYMNRLKIRQLKRETVKNLTKSFLDNHTEKEIDQFYRDECKDVLNNVDINNW